MERAMLMVCCFRTLGPAMGLVLASEGDNHMGDCWLSMDAAMVVGGCILAKHALCRPIATNMVKIGGQHWNQKR